MLNTVYKEAIKNRDAMLSILRGPKFEQIVERAKQNWIEYKPKKQDAVMAGIDSSFNSTKFQGMELWVVTAVSIKTDGGILSDNHKQGLSSNVSDLSSIASKMEIDACKETVDLVDITLMDGSLYSQFMTRQSGLTHTILKIMAKKQNVVFVAKTSNTRMQFLDLESLAGDIFYYNHATKTPGFSRVYVDKKFGKDKAISSIYARLSDSTPLIKIEMLGDSHTEDEVKSLLDKLYKNSVGGYPYALKLAHNNCKISSADLGKLVSLYGISNEIGSREVLE
ncbi:MAG: DNA double-strand break repair nuclease NurA [Candidatus Nitrosotenuis sp.]|nr:MAG: DNA double-strand break repair nuclease NurA [Candidatus Nitrosotenuis sp.]